MSESVTNCPSIEEFQYYYGLLKLALLEQQGHFDQSECREIPVLRDLGRWTGHATRQLVALTICLW